jgi:hypothetical protein
MLKKCLVDLKIVKRNKKKTPRELEATEWAATELIP